MSEVPLYPEDDHEGTHAVISNTIWQGYLAHKKTPLPLETQHDPRHRPAVVSKGGCFLMSEVPL